MIYTLFGVEVEIVGKLKNEKEVFVRDVSHEGNGWEAWRPPYVLRADKDGELLSAIADAPVMTKKIDPSAARRKAALKALNEGIG